MKDDSFNIVTNISELRKKNFNTDLDEAKSIINKLEISLKKSKHGIGLAAPQIGIHKKVSIIRLDSEYIDLVNPNIVDRSIGMTFFCEKCLSLPGSSINTHRFKEIFVKDDLHPAGFVATGMVSIAIQHECDHLDGILIIDRTVGKNKIGRNDPCPCGRIENGKSIKWKKCHGKNC